MILMLQQSDKIWEQLTFATGSRDILLNMPSISPKQPFSDDILEFLNGISKILMKAPEAKAYPEVITLGFWLRKPNMLQLKKRFEETKENRFRIGKGTVFHIAPSNVAVNYAYSLFTGLVTGNSNIVRLPTKDFYQVNIINKAIKEMLELKKDMVPYVCLVRYGHNKEINDLLSSLADIRVIWGGDTTIREIRNSALKPRAIEITFADRFSFSIINADMYLECPKKDILAQGFYNDTYLTDQNACTSPKIVVWTGYQKENAKKIFWSELKKIVNDKYFYQNIQGVNKLTSLFMLASSREGVHREAFEDNLSVQVKVDVVDERLIDYTDNSGYFLEYDCEDIMELRALCNEKCQTVSYYGDKENILSLLNNGIRGIDRIVPIGKTMDFDLIWDGYNLVEQMTRLIAVY